MDIAVTKLIWVLGATIVMVAMLAKFKKTGHKPLLSGVASFGFVALMNGIVLVQALIELS
jgi:hypothetical protein